MRIVRWLCLVFGLAFSGSSFGVGLCIGVNYVEGINGNGEPDMVPVLYVVSDNDEKYNCPYWFIPLASEEPAEGNLGFIPPLTAEEGGAIGTSIFVAFAIAFGFRMMRKIIEDTDHVEGA